MVIEVGMASWGAYSITYLANRLLMEAWMSSEALVPTSSLLTNLTASLIEGVATGSRPISAGDLGMGTMWTAPSQINTCEKNQSAGHQTFMYYIITM